MGDTHDPTLLPFRLIVIRAGQLIKIEVLDHIIVGEASLERVSDYVSLREAGYCAV
jgi:DNA repair protein RadC